MTNLFVGECDRCGHSYHAVAAPVLADWSEIRVVRLDVEADHAEELRFILCAACTQDFKDWYEGEDEHV